MRHLATLAIAHSLALCKRVLLYSFLCIVLALLILAFLLPIAQLSFFPCQRRKSAGSGGMRHHVFLPSISKCTTQGLRQNSSATDVVVPSHGHGPTGNNRLISKQTDASRSSIPTHFARLLHISSSPRLNIHSPPALIQWTSEDLAR